MALTQLGRDLALERRALAGDDQAIEALGDAEFPCPDCFAPAGRFCYAHCPRYAEVIYERED